MEDGGSTWLVDLRIPQTANAITRQIGDRAVVGRVDKPKDEAPEIDLTTWDAMELGVAPEHVTIFTHGDQLNLVDMGSGRPTILNGVPVEPGVPQLLPSGSILQLGVLEMQVNVLSAPGETEITYYHPPAASAVRPSAGSGQPVLVVEDEPETAEIFRLVMERAGFVPFICHEVVSAIRFLNVQAPSAIILDLMLPDIHGLELCRYVRRDIAQRDVPIVVVTAGVTRANMVDAIEAGADVFLGKPVSIRELVRVVASLIQWNEARTLFMRTKHLDGTDTLRAMPAEVRRDALVLFVAGYDEPLAVVVPDRITIGRRGSGYVPRPHVDLDRYGAFEAGVSRVHAALYRDAEGFSIEDLGSSNGTRVDGAKLNPNERHPLTNASEISLGSLRLRVFYVTEEDDLVAGQIAPVDDSTDVDVHPHDETREL